MVELVYFVIFVSVGFLIVLWCFDTAWCGYCAGFVCFWVTGCFDLGLLFALCLSLCWGCICDLLRGGG